MTDYEQIKASVEAIDAEYGTIRVLVNNAGVWHGKTFFDISPSDYDFTYGVNARAPFFLSQEVAKRLVKAGGGGVIVNLASIVATIGSGVTDYGGSKAAIVNLTKSLAKPLGPHGIRVAAVSPGTINTAMGEKVPKEIRDKLIAGSGLQRAAEPEEIACGRRLPGQRRRPLYHRRDARRQRRPLRRIRPIRVLIPRSGTQRVCIARDRWTRSMDRRNNVWMSF